MLLNHPSAKAKILPAFKTCLGSKEFECVNLAWSSLVAPTSVPWPFAGCPSLTAGAGLSSPLALLF